jgi:NAD(P)H-dependent FMN reductase
MNHTNNGDPFRVLAICGSLRRASINAALLRAARRLSPPGMVFLDAPSLGEVPPFNPDDDDDPPPPVQALRIAVAAADGLLLATPEYAHGVSGVMKNALDWMVSFEPFINKPVAVLNAAARAHHADRALRETLLTMSASLVGDGSYVVPLPRWTSEPDAATFAADAGVAASLAQAFQALRDECLRRRLQEMPVFKTR